MKKYGHCLECKRFLPTEFMKRVEYYNGHLIKGAYHHQLLCNSCEEKAGEVFKQTYNGVPIEDIKVGGTD